MVRGLGKYEYSSSLKNFILLIIGLFFLKNPLSPHTSRQEGRELPSLPTKNGYGFLATSIDF